MPSALLPLTGLGFAAFDVFMCGNAEPRKAIEVFKRAFNPGRVVVGEHKRGVV